MKAKAAGQEAQGLTCYPSASGRGGRKNLEAILCFTFPMDGVLTSSDHCHQHKDHQYGYWISREPFFLSGAPWMPQMLSEKK